MEPAAGEPELDRKGIMSRFGPHHGASQRMHWVRPGLTVAAAVTQHGSLEVSEICVAHDMQHSSAKREPEQQLLCRPELQGTA